MVNYKIVDIEGIGETYGAKLNRVGIATTGDLLQAAGTKTGRSKLAADTGLPESLILTWVNHADLMRIKGVGPQISELLEASGVDTVKELAQRNATNLHAKMQQVNDEYGLSGKVPSVAELAEIIAAAGSMDAAVSH